VKKIALVFLLAVFVPSLVLAWLAVRSLRDQQLVLERQQTLLYQGVADGLVREANLLADRQHEFGQQVEALLAAHKPEELATTFDSLLRAAWPPAEVGFVVTEGGKLACPSPYSSEAAKTFYAENGKFVCNIQSAEVYWTPKNIVNYNNNNNSAQMQQLFRNVTPQQQALESAPENAAQNYSKAAPAEAEFRQLVGDSSEGTVARFLDNKLKVLLWYRARSSSGLIFGAQLSMDKLKEGLIPVVRQFEPALRDDIAVALLDDNAKPVAVSRVGFQTDWKRPFVASELGEALPHWEMAVYLLNPAKLAKSAHMLKLTLGLLIGLLLLAIGVGGWLIVADLNRQLGLARQKTDFVSNVSHELKTPLTSIRMFAELLAEGRVSDPAKSRSYLHIISAEASRLTRLINNVLDFSRLERGEKKYNFQACDLTALLRETVQTYRPHLEANGFELRAELPEQPAAIRGDRDALAQVIVNLLSNAEKYSNGRKEITLQIEPLREPLPYVDVRILDRGPGVPADCGEKIFEQFYRAHDSLSSGIQGSGLGLTLARQIARAHGGDVLYRPRDGGGSCFTLRLPLDSQTPQPSA
jgi:signal transduction histidine kinase